MAAVPDITPTLNPQPSARIRLATSSDAAAIARVLRQSFQEFQPRYTPQGFAVTTPDEQRVRLRMTEGPAWLALSDDSIVGTASALKKPASTLYIRGLAVLPAARGQNVGAMLLETLENYALAEGCNRLMLRTTPYLSAAIRLYERFGFRFIADGPNDLFGTPLLAMEKPLGGESSFYETHRKEQLCRKIMDSLTTETLASA
jgi:GNAT superfamily N-acetyltransferase